MKNSEYIFKFFGLIFVGFLFINGIQAKDFSKPIIVSASPSLIQVSLNGGSITIVLKGEHFTVNGTDCVWNARETMLFVRNTGKGGAWQGLFNPYRTVNAEAAWPNPPQQFGRYGCIMVDGRISVTLPVNIWCIMEGSLEFLLTKGEVDYKNEWYYRERTRSNIFSIPVTKEIAQYDPRKMNDRRQKKAATLPGTPAAIGQVRSPAELVSNQQLQLGRGADGAAIINQPVYRKKIGRIARLVAGLKPEQRILSEAEQAFKRFAAETGHLPGAADVFLDHLNTAIKKEVLKKKKGKELRLVATEQIFMKNMMTKIKEMIHSLLPQIRK